MQIDWTTILSSAVASASLFGALAWLTRSIIAQFLTKDIERFKATLQLATVEHQIRFGRLHEKRALVIAEFYEKLLPAKYCFTSLKGSKAKGFEEQDRLLARKLVEICMDAYAFSQRNALYFEDAMFQKISKLNMELLRHVGFYAGLDEIVTSFRDVPPERQKMVEESVVTGWRNLEDSFTPLLEELKKEFKTLLGVEGMQADPQ